MSRTIHGRSHQALSHFRAHPAALAVYWIYVSRMNNEGVAWPSSRGMASDTGWNRETCLNARAHLIALKALELVEGYVRPQWRALPAADLKKRQVLDKAEYYRPTGFVIVDGAKLYMLYNGGDEDSALDSDGRFGRPSNAPTVGQTGQNLDSILELDSNPKKKKKKEVSGATPPTPRQTYGELHPELSEQELDAQAAALAKVDPARPAPGESEIIPPRAKDDPIFDAWERVRGLKNDPQLIRDYQDRNGWIARWLKGEVGNWRTNKLGRLETLPTVKEVEGFGAWYQNKYPAIGLPIDPVKFVGHWRTYAAERKAHSPAPTPQAASLTPELEALIAEAVALGSRGLTPAGTALGLRFKRMTDAGQSLANDPVFAAFNSAYNAWKKGSKS